MAKRALKIASYRSYTASDVSTALDLCYCSRNCPYDKQLCGERSKKGDPELYIRPWILVNSTDIWRYIGCLLYIGLYVEARRKEHWIEKGYLRYFISLTRYNQIYRYFTLRNGESNLRKDRDIRLEIRAN
jgi:hypothetical protein